jgi:GntR family transcriptional regulator
VRDRILGLIKGLEPNEKLPGEAALASLLSVSRATVRDALTHLERDGFVIRRHGVGTFVAPQRAQLGTVLNEIKPIPDVIAASGYTPGIGSLEVRKVLPDPEVSEGLRLSPSNDEPVSAVSILFLADDQPAIDITYFLSPALSRCAIDWTTFDGSMVATVERILRQRVHQTHARISAVNATKALAERLHVDEGRAVLRFATTALLVDGRIAYYSVSYQDSDTLAVRVVRNRHLSLRDG